MADLTRKEQFAFLLIMLSNFEMGLVLMIDILWFSWLPTIAKYVSWSWIGTLVVLPLSCLAFYSCCRLDASVIKHGLEPLMKKKEAKP